MVPNIAFLGCVLDQVRKLYEKSLVTVPVEGERAMFTMLAAHTDVEMCTQWDKSWDEYVRGNVVSESAAKLIRSLMLKTIAAAGMPHDDNSSNDEGLDDNDADIPTLKLDKEGLEKILNPYTEVTKSDDDDSNSSDRHKTAKKFDKRRRLNNF